MSGIGSIRAGLNPYLGNLDETQDMRAMQRAKPQASTNVMSGNFAKLERSRSVYVEAHLESFGQKTLLETIQNQNTTALILEAKSHFLNIDDDDYTGKYLASRKIEQMMYRKRREKEQEAGEEAAEAVKEDREKRIAEAIAPKDANGEPILVGPDAAAAPEAAAPDLPEAPAATAPAPTTPSEQIDVAAAVPLTGGTIDITV